jgi:excisionase family DNA binding protein
MPGDLMKTLGLHEAAAFLHCHPEELRRRAKAGSIPGAKVGRAWVFLEEDLAAYLRSLYAQPRQALQVTLRKEMECHFANAAGSGGSTFARPTANEYAELLKLPTKP